MLKVELNGNDGIVKVEACGSLPELMADVTTMLNVIYEGIEEEQRQCFKNCVKRLADEELYAKTNKELMDKLVKNKKEELKKRLEKELKELKELSGFIKGLFD